MPPAPLSIADVERGTGLPRATIRMWERRYGFPAPDRDARGERVYPHDQVERLRLMRELLGQGHRPAKLIALGTDGLQSLAQQARAPAAAPARRGRLAGNLVRLLQKNDPAAVRAELEQSLARSGLAAFASREVPALNRAIGESWAAGELQIHGEHLYSDCLEQVLRPAIAALVGTLRPEAPTVLLTTFAQERHGLGLLAAQAVFAAEGCTTVSLGVALPVDQIVAAARAYGADLVGLSVTGAMNPSHLLRGLEELRGLLPISVRIWVGGNLDALRRRRPIPGVRTVPDADAIPALLAEDFALPPREQA